jgi:hypothetical protein
MKKVVLIIICLLSLSVSNAVMIQETNTYLELSKIDFLPLSNNQHALYLDIFNVTNVPTFIVLLQGQNVTFNWSRIAFLNYNSPYGASCVAPIDSSSAYLVFKRGPLISKHFMLMGRLEYVQLSPMARIDLIAVREFSLGKTYYPTDYIIDSLLLPEPATITILGFGLLFLFKRTRA